MAVISQYAKKQSYYFQHRRSQNISLHILLHDETIAITQSYTSLGIVFVWSGSFRQACNVLTDKAKTKLLSYIGLTPQ